MILTQNHYFKENSSQIFHLILSLRSALHLSKSLFIRVSWFSYFTYHLSLRDTGAGFCFFSDQGTGAGDPLFYIFSKTLISTLFYCLKCLKQNAHENAHKIAHNFCISNLTTIPLFIMVSWVSGSCPRKGF